MIPHESFLKGNASQDIYTHPSPSKRHIFHIVLHDHVKLYKCIYFYTYIVSHNIKWIYMVLNLHEVS
jgi:hypothetical protein